MSATQTFRELTYTMRPQGPHGDGTGLRFETDEHGGDYPDNMPQAISVTDARGRCARTANFDTALTSILIKGKAGRPEGRPLIAAE
jgi:hypothetical protein